MPASHEGIQTRFWSHDHRAEVRGNCSDWDEIGTVPSLNSVPRKVGQGGLNGVAWSLVIGMRRQAMHLGD